MTSWGGWLIWRVLGGSWVCLGEARLGMVYGGGGMFFFDFFKIRGLFVTK